MASIQHKTMRIRNCDVVQGQAEVTAQVVSEHVAARLEEALVGVGEVCECREDEADFGGVV